MSNRSNPGIEAAWAYERLHVNALFRQWVEPVLDAAAVTMGNSVLDVACGTGVAARAACSRVGPEGSVTGLDIDRGMLSVAESIEPGVRWIEGDAGQLPFPNGNFDAVVSQFGLMFFPEPVRAIREMLRCVKSGGRLVVAVWDALERSQAYPISVDLLKRRAGSAAAAALRAPFVMGDVDALRDLFEQAGATAISIRTQHGTATFPSVRSMVEADLRGWLPLMGVFLEDALIESVLSEADEALSEFVASDGTMVFDAPAHIVECESAAARTGPNE